MTEAIFLFITMAGGVAIGLMIYDVLKWMVVGTVRKTKNAIHRKTGWKIFMVK